MSINVTTNYKNNSVAGQGQSAETPNTETLKSVFVTAMQNSMTNRMFKDHTSIVDINIEIQDSANERKEQLNKNQRESLQQSERRDFTREDKRILNQSEVRHEQLENDYNRKMERNENLQTEYCEKNELRDSITEQKINRIITPFLETISSVSASPAVSTIPTSSTSATLSTLSESSERRITGLLQESVSVPVTPGMVSPSFLLAGSNPISVANSSAVQPTIQPVSASTTSAIPVAALDAVSVMTIFTASGRFGINKEETEEKNEIEKKKEKEKTKEKKGIISLFGQGFTGITQPVMYKNHSNYFLPDTETEYNAGHNTKPESNNDTINIVQKDADTTGQELEQKSESELEQDSKPDENRTKLTLENWFYGDQTVENSSVQPNESESSDQLRFIQRVAAACQSAANQHGTVRIKLHLDKLGTLTLRITAKSNKLSVRFEVTSSAVARLIRNSINELQTTLTEQNIVLEHTEIDMI
ncbi:MAG: flagellar hook-length control protein FliK [Planctomycetaceae bacterium]|jgi:flagellar hook-length control protein FliK|nr:flagellar hook-length control protein FliK [Planctomycetaceae bacterium]